MDEGAAMKIYPRTTQQRAWKRDVGSAEAQIAYLTGKVIRLTSHLAAHKKDYSSQRGLSKSLGARKRLLSYLFRKDLARYHELLLLLEIRGLRVK